MQFFIIYAYSIEWKIIFFWKVFGGVNIFNKNLRYFLIKKYINMFWSYVYQMNDHWECPPQEPHATVQVKQGAFHQCHSVTTATVTATKRLHHLTPLCFQPIFKKHLLHSSRYQLFYCFCITLLNNSGIFFSFPLEEYPHKTKFRNVLALLLWRFWFVRDWDLKIH